MSYAPASSNGRFGRATRLHRLRESDDGQACPAKRSVGELSKYQYGH
jgi:hypothetical protein